MQEPTPTRRFASPHHSAPRTHLLGNGNYSVMMTAAGCGYSRWQDVAVTRWREDPTCDPWGSYVILRDEASGRIWSAGYQPVGREPDRYEALFHEERVIITRTDGPLITSTEIVVSAEDDAEVRRVSLTNTGTVPREIELTTYAEVVLTTAEADSAHQAFAKLFVRTDFVPRTGALLATRRNRDPGAQQLWAAHFSVLEGEAAGDLQFETDRARFLGRGNELRDAAAVLDVRSLSNTSGTVLDPIFALRRRVKVPPGGTVHVAFWTLLAQTRPQALSLIDKLGNAQAFIRAKASALAQAKSQLRELGASFEDAQLFQRIANQVLYADASLRAPRNILDLNRAGPPALWAFGVSGDLPLVLIRIGDENGLHLVKLLLRAREYWRLKRLAADVIIFNDRPASHGSDLQPAIDAAIASVRPLEQPRGETRPGKVFALRSEAMPASGGDALETAARAVFFATGDSLEDQLGRVRESPATPRLQVSTPAAERPVGTSNSAPALEFFNGFGGFAAGGREYVSLLDGGRRTPAPWVNIVANPHFGFQASADGAGSTWSRNSREYQLTPWSNDPVSDPPSEVIYLRDDDSGDLWSATPLPIRQPSASYTVRHGFGYSRFEHVSHGIAGDLLMFVPLADPVKISRLKLVNRSETARRLVITHYVDWVLGNQRSRTAPFIITEIEPKTSALLARNPWRTEFESRVAFLDACGRQQACTGDRREFVGRHGSLAEPAALLTGNRLSNCVGGGLDPCGALQFTLVLEPGEEVERVFMLGDAESTDEAVALIGKYRAADLEEVRKFVTDDWERTLGAIQVKTPDRTIDVLLNGWLLYQALACRVWGRSGFYQASGAYGYRDQLQDVMALCISRPAIAREHILRAAARQFMAGDVQHWWLPTSGQGVQTRVSDDRVWLPFVVCHYLEVCGDTAVLDELLPFLEGPPLAAGQQEIFTSPKPTTETATLFEHCVRALDGSLAVGSHGLPLFGAGDWNDGMNRVGIAGRGESVWLGWFLYATLQKFAVVAERRSEPSIAARWRTHARAVQQAIEDEAWDGEWYRRGYFDDGSPLGSAGSEECRIDAIAQSWGVISGGAQADRAAQAMSAVNDHLVSRSDRLVKLFTPPFDCGERDPGYIQAYPPGLRENGGQYTHAAMWTTLAFAMMGDGDRAAELFSLLNPINHAGSGAAVERYKVEPYVVCADVYSAESHVGRGGWTWYTGSAAWMYRTAMEGILGIHKRGDTLSIDPCIPRAWSGFEITCRHGSSSYCITVENPKHVCRGIARARLDGQEIAISGCIIPLIDDGARHDARITLG